MPRDSAALYGVEEDVTTEEYNGKKTSKLKILGILKCRAIKHK